MTLHFGAAWVFVLPLVDNLVLGARAERAAPSIGVTKSIMVKLAPTIYTGQMLLFASPVSLGWWLHFYTRLGFNPFACAFVGFGAEVLVTGFDELSIMERVAAADLAELLVQFVGILFQFVIADTALHRKFG